MHLGYIVLISFFFFPQKSAKTAQPGSPLSEYSAEWNAAKYKACNTAAAASYMTAEEKTVIYVLNLARTNPKLFSETVVKPYSAANNIDLNSEKYYKSLVRQMSSMEPLKMLQPDQVCFASASCHAETAGKKGYVGHERQSDKCRKLKKYNGECCSYGTPDPVGIVVTLLVDEDVESLGHREICLGNYSKIGVAKRPHTEYGSNTVLDLLF